mmetsp:Transcript_3338/g.5058  ORF Transcript_3338/g.5058 Transcript_3338/m.5058 type:complete len:184 (-) Transcript_3338:448-999(-)|eukprot:CAMPEP_0184675618 /NCGR_PEP_ID=MMETSP0308-20130426/87887_1 /TAXON_ID=38269 /ORGANISM="Gloeochaete witrockiana, Strain SAG 46.84" /LENGTH=183 /DNA_ID=CAMNT_0027123337 /DNA_START=135 /DNA_END=686 /DNA_ORIENTATION=-
MKRDRGTFDDPSREIQRSGFKKGGGGGNNLQYVRKVPKFLRGLLQSSEAPPQESATPIERPELPETEDEVPIIVPAEDLMGLSARDKKRLGALSSADIPVDFTVEEKEKETKAVEEEQPNDGRIRFRRPTSNKKKDVNKSDWRKYEDDDDSKRRSKEKRAEGRENSNSGLGASGRLSFVEDDE